VDDVRQINDAIRYAPASARYKVYILDEVHMLSGAAFNALLKTLEEPPPHAKFIFATTEIRKVPITILSRCQRFDLRRVEADRLVSHLEGIATKESVVAEPEALALIARAAEGSVRDALSLFDQAIAHAAGPVRAEDVRQMLGLDPRAREFRVVYGSVAANDKELAILSRSILEILIELSSFISVPEAHVVENRVRPTAEPEMGPGGPVPPLIRINSSSERPANSFVSVPYRDYWFWIDDRDIPSKRLFTFLMFVFTLVETGGKEGAPVVTIPAQ